MIYNNGKKIEKKDRNHNKFSLIYKVICFLLIGIMLFQGSQQLFKPKWFPYDDSYDAGKMRGYLNEKKDSIDILICGASHASRGIYPMELYEKFGFKSYNLSTSGQPIEATYYLLKEAFLTQNPQVVIFDVSSLYFGNSAEYSWRYVIDDMPLGKTKIDFAKEYCEINKEETIQELILPLMRYHTRWKELQKQDFNYMFYDSQHHFGKGCKVSSLNNRGITADMANLVAEELLLDNEKNKYTYNEGVWGEEHIAEVLYNVEIPQYNINWMLKIKDLCDKNNTLLLAVKIPVTQYPQMYWSAWNMAKYHKVQSFCNDNNIIYYDLLYDTDVDINWDTDSRDSGMHLNLYGAQKISINIGKYLEECFNISGEYDNYWDQDLLLYQKVRKVALLELEQNFITYIEKLRDEFQDTMIFIAASDDMSQGLNEMDFNVLQSLGLQTDFSGAIRNSYMAVIDNGQVIYEALSNRPLVYEGVRGRNEIKYRLYSAGWWTNANASIIINNREYAVNSRGINIVVYDKKRELVLDSVCFDTSVDFHASVRNNVMINDFEEAFEQYIMDVEDKMVTF